MVLARARTDNNEELLIIGLSAENRRRMANGMPVSFTTFTGEETHATLRVVIFAGETEDAMQQELLPLMNQQTTIVKGGR